MSDLLGKQPVSPYPDPLRTLYTSGVDFRGLLHYTVIHHRVLYSIQMQLMIK